MRHLPKSSLGTPDKEHCKKLLRKLSDYLDGELDARTEKKIKRHLKKCIPCLASYRTLRWSVEALRRYPSEPVPKNIRLQLRRNILKIKGRDV